jgi:reactive intermediate/imine deaminase
MKQYHNPEALSKPTGYTHLVETSGSRTLYLSGQIAFDAAGNVVGRGDMQVQTEQVFKNIEAALAVVGASFADVVKVSYFITDISQMQKVREVRNRYFASDRLPASTAVEVSRLVHPDLLIEIEAVAVLE